MESMQFSEAVYLFADKRVAAELTYQDFLLHIEQQTPLPDAVHSAALSRACYVRLDCELQVVGLVFFLLRIDQQRRPDKSFNMPFPYLVQNAGPGPDFGNGPVPMARRGSCPVPWHANNLWDPSQDDAQNPLTARRQSQALGRAEHAMKNRQPSRKSIPKS